jgi:hypothetical protein
LSRLRWPAHASLSKSATRDSPVDLDAPAAAPEGSPARSKYGTAIHEAGHAVINRVLGGEIDLVSIIAKDDYRGICRTTVTTNPVELYALREAIVSCAGGEAERLMFGSTSDEANRGDEENLANKLELLPPELRLESRVREMAALLVRRHKPEIMIVAVHLYLKKQLSGAEVERVMALAKVFAAPA